VHILNKGKYLFLLTMSVLFIIVLGQLVLNIAHGLDITDESYYILVAAHPNELFSTVTHEGYYTGLLYFLSSYHLSYFRLLGILLLLGVSIWFTIELFKYISKKFDFSYQKLDKYLFALPIAMGSLVYYQYWLLTPSYDWLALVSVILVIGSLFRVVNRKIRNYNEFLTFDYVILSFSLSLSFMAKPTTALGLTLLSIIFVIYEHKNINLKKSIISIIMLTGLIVSLHIVFLDGGFLAYYERLTEGMERQSLMDGSYTLGNRYNDLIILLKAYFFEKFYYHRISNIIIYLFVVLVTMLYALRHKINARKIYLVLMFIILTIYAFFMFRYSINHNRLADMLWFNTIELLCINIGLVLIFVLFSKNKLQLLKHMFYILPLLFIILLGSFAVSFGTNNNILMHMISSIIFVIVAILIWNYIFEKTEELKLFVSLMGTISAVIIYFAIQNAYEHPYRLETSIKEQNQYIDFLGGIYVDAGQKKYIKTLQSIAEKNKKKNEKISLIDMTGGTPAANVILDAEFFGEAWLLGYYKGSNEFVYRALSSYKNTNKLKNAWILTAPKGVLRLNLNILKKLGLDFPNDYVKIGIVKTTRRNEIQELWKPR